MRSYRAYLLDADGHIIDRIELSRGDDESAKAQANSGWRAHDRDVRAT
jgi:hypothetical protein